MDIEAQRKKAREAQARYRERQKAAGIKRERTDEDRRRDAQKQAAYRQRQRLKFEETGIKPDSMTWAARNKEKHRENVRRWRAENVEKSRQIMRENQRDRRSTPWGAINNRVWPVMHAGVRGASFRWGKYNHAIGYTWATLRAHLELLFEPGMTWDNWGEAWEVDHIIPVSRFQYTSIDDPLFAQAWSLDNLRPLWADHNQAKGAK